MTTEVNYNCSWGNDCTCYMFFPDTDIRKYQMKPVILDTFQITDIFWEMALLKGEEHLVII